MFYIKSVLFILHSGTMSVQDQEQNDIKTLSNKIEQLESRIKRIEQQQGLILETIQHQGQSLSHPNQQKQHRGELCSVKGCTLTAVTTCEHGLSGFSEPCGRKICVNHVTKRESGWGYGRGIKEYCPMHA